jgi:hypothetical protein
LLPHKNHACPLQLGSESLSASPSPINSNPPTGPTLALYTHPLRYERMPELVKAIKYSPAQVFARVSTPLCSSWAGGLRACYHARWSSLHDLTDVECSLFHHPPPEKIMVSLSPRCLVDIPLLRPLSLRPSGFRDPSSLHRESIFGGSIARPLVTEMELYAYMFSCTRKQAWAGS